MPCLDCGTPGHRRRCPTCARGIDRARGTTAARGYDSEHQRERNRWRPLVEAGGVTCRRGDGLIQPGEPWDLGHPDADCPAPRAPEHRHCNRATATRR